MKTIDTILISQSWCISNRDHSNTKGRIVSRQKLGPYSFLDWEVNRLWPQKRLFRKQPNWILLLSWNSKSSVVHTRG